MKSLQRLVVGGSPMTGIGRKGRRLDQFVPPPDFHAMVQVSPLAIMAMVGLAFDSLRIARALPGVALAAGVEYVSGLMMLARRATAARIARLLGGLAFAGLVVLDALRHGTDLTLGQAREEITRLVFARTRRGKWELVSLQPAPSDALDGLDEAKEIVSESLGKVSQLSLPEVEWLEAA